MARAVATTESVVKNKNLTIRTNDTEYQRIKDFAKFQGKTLSAFVMDAVWAQIEDWEDMNAAKDYLERKSKGEVKTIPHDVFMKEFDSL